MKFHKFPNYEAAAKAGEDVQQEFGLKFDIHETDTTLPWLKLEECVLPVLEIDMGKFDDDLEIDVKLTVAFYGGRFLPEKEMIHHH